MQKTTIIENSGHKEKGGPAKHSCRFSPYVPRQEESHGDKEGHVNGQSTQQRSRGRVKFPRVGSIKNLEANSQDGHKGSQDQRY